MKKPELKFVYSHLSPVKQLLRYRNRPNPDDRQAIGWTCFCCCHCFPLTAAYTEQEMDDGTIRHICVACSESRLEFYEEIEAKQKKKNASAHS
ncbi:MAG: hypothetical protein FWD53_01625 [Phycisphaerales bacterium]|nr:hypothetical protein [Phycisphaerales bacterium]